MIILLLGLLMGSANAQTITLGSAATFKLGSQASFFAGGNTTLNGTFDNQGTIISYSNLNLMNNTRHAGLRFVGQSDQTITANDTIRVKRMTMAKSGKLNLQVRRLIVEDLLDIISGVLGAGADTTLLVSGEITGGGNDGYIEGKLVHFSKLETIRFPLGLNGFYNGLTLTGVPPNTLIVVEVRQADPDILMPSEDMIGIADEVEWAITAMSNQDSVEVGISATFNGVDLSIAGLPNGQDVRSRERAPALAKYGKGDSLYVDLGIADIRDTDGETFGTVDARSTFFISDEPTLISVSLIPFLDAPQFFVPDAFSPTAVLEENRVFRPYFAGAKITSVDFRVFDQFQSSVYSFRETGDDIDLSTIGWDGISSGGTIADVGVYYYSVTLIADGITYPETGSFLLAN